MKELSVEEKAKAYDEALRYAMIYYKEGNEDMKMMMKTCFPALVEESEDERIRKAITEYLRQRLDRSPSIPAAIGSWLAWLEKQGEQKPQRMISAEAKEAIYGKPAYAWSEEDEEHIHSLLDRLEWMCKKDATFTATRFAVNQDIDWLKSIKQKIVG